MQVFGRASGTIRSNRAAIAPIAELCRGKKQGINPMVQSPPHSRPWAPVSFPRRLRALMLALLLAVAIPYAAMQVPCDLAPTL